MFGGDRRSRDAIVAALAFGVLHAVPVSAADSLAICASGAGPRAPVPVPEDLEADVATDVRPPHRPRAPTRLRALRRR